MKVGTKKRVDDNSVLYHIRTYIVVNFKQLASAKASTTLKPSRFGLDSRRVRGGREFFFGLSFVISETDALKQFSGIMHYNSNALIVVWGLKTFYGINKICTEPKHIFNKLDKYKQCIN